MSAPTRDGELNARAATTRVSHSPVAQAGTSMTSDSLLTALLPLISDLARDLPEAERYKRLLDALRVPLPCHATAVLRLEGEWLVPLAVNGLSHDTLGRRFKVDEHPRLAALLEAPGPVRFAANCGLPDPFDGLVYGVQGHLPVHDCMGCVLRVDGRPWGVLTLDALDVGQFTADALPTLEAFGSLAAATVNVAAQLQQLALRAEDEHQRAESYAAREKASFGVRRLLGKSAAHEQLLQEISFVGPSELTVLIQGETGVGKELVAQALHAASPRGAKALVSINCAALPDNLVESELFGHVRGAFTGAVGDRRGKFDLAHNGTLFLDEVAELPLTVQAKLLRVLQSGQLQRPGSDREHSADVRIIAATNRDLAQEVREGRMRPDFFHRLSVYPLHVPALRDRGRDVLLISGFFLEEARSRMGLGGLRLDASAQAALLAYDWPGNVRELEHLLGRSVVKSLGRHGGRPRILTLSAADLGLEAHETPPPSSRVAASLEPAGSATTGSLREAVMQFERRMVLQALHDNNQQWAAAARALQLDSANLVRLAKRLGISRQDARAGAR